MRQKTFWAAIRGRKPQHIWTFYEGHRILKWRSACGLVYPNSGIVERSREVFPDCKNCLRAITK